MGAYNLMQFDEAIEGGAMAILTRYEGWAPQEVQILTSKARSDSRRPDVHVLFDLYVQFSKLSILSSLLYCWRIPLPSNRRPEPCPKPTYFSSIVYIFR